MAWAHAVAAVIEDAPGQQGLGLRPCRPMIVELFTERGLHGFKQLAIDNGGLP